MINYFSDSSEPNQHMEPSDNTDEKPYLSSNVQVKCLFSQKKAAFEQLQSDIETISNFVELYRLFAAVKNADKGILRKHQKNIWYVYGDTDTYIKAIAEIANAASQLMSTITLFADCNKCQEIYLEAKRVDPANLAYKAYIKQLKQQALAIFTESITQQQYHMNVLSLYKELQLPTNILRYHQENLIYSYGDTDSYKAALLCVGQQTVKLGLIYDPMQIQCCETLCYELDRCQPRLNNKEWKQLVDNLKKCMRVKDIQRETSRLSLHLY